MRLDVSEAEFLDAVIELAQWHGWLVYHARPARYQDGRWATHYQGDAGFPDLVLAHSERGVIIAELKTVKGRLTGHQASWLLTFELAGLEAAVWTPKDWPQIVHRLTGRPQHDHQIEET